MARLHYIQRPFPQSLTLPVLAILLSLRALVFSAPSVKLLLPEKDFRTTETRLTRQCEIDGEAQALEDLALNMGDNAVFCTTEYEDSTYYSDTIKVTRNCPVFCLVKIIPDSLHGDSIYFTKDSTVTLYWTVWGDARDSSVEMLDPGKNRFGKFYEDADGVSGADSVTVYYDPLPPEIDISHVLDNLNPTNPNYKFPVQVTDNIGLRRVFAEVKTERESSTRVDTFNLSYADGDWILQFPREKDQNVTIRFVAVDKAGNATDTATGAIGNLDKTPPKFDPVRPSHFKLEDGSDTIILIENIMVSDEKKVGKVRLLDVTDEQSQKELTQLSRIANTDAWKGRFTTAGKSEITVQFSAEDTSRNKSNTPAIRLTFRDTLPPFLSKDRINIHYDEREISTKKPFALKDTVQPFCLIPKNKLGMKAIHYVLAVRLPTKSETSSELASNDKTQWWLENTPYEANSLTDLLIIPEDLSGNRDTLVVKLKSWTSFGTDLTEKRENQWHLIGLPYPVTYNELKGLMSKTEGPSFFKRVDGETLISFNPEKTDTLLEAGSAFFWGSLTKSLGFKENRYNIPRRPYSFLSLDSGWNLVSSPFPFQVIVKESGSLKPTIMRMQFKNSDYSWRNTDTLRPFEGYAVHVNARDTLYFIDIRDNLSQKRAPSRSMAELTERISGHSVYFSNTHAATPLLRAPGQRNSLAVLEAGRNFLLTSRPDRMVKTIALTLEKSARVNLVLKGATGFEASALYDLSLSDNLLDKTLSLPAGRHSFILAAGPETFLEEIEVPEDFPVKFAIIPLGTLAGATSFPIAYQLPPGLSYPVNILLTFFSPEGRTRAERVIQARTQLGRSILDAPGLPPGMAILRAALTSSGQTTIQKFTILK